MQSTAFVACIERGVLEWQAVLLFESIRLHGGAFASCPIFALSPRKGHAISRRARRRLEALGVVYLDKVLNTECAEYGPANRVFAAAHIEAHHPHDVLVVLDSDTLFLREPGAFALDSDVDVRVRPVDVKGMCTTGPDNPCERYWRDLAVCCGTHHEVLPWTCSFVDRVRIRASYNAGLAVARGRLGIMQTCADFFLRSVRAGLRPHDRSDGLRSGTGAVASAGGRWWGSSQAVLSLAIWASTRRVVELPATYNYPLHSHAQIDAGTRDAVFGALVHAHYHWLFEADSLSANPLLGPRSPLAPLQRRWLEGALAVR